jgi:hypothetical protein
MLIVALVLPLALSYFVQRVGGLTFMTGALSAALFVASASMILHTDGRGVLRLGNMDFNEAQIMQTVLVLAPLHAAVAWIARRWP